MFEFAGTDAQRAQTLYGEYRAAGGPGRIDRPQSFSMDIAQLGHVGECRVDGGSIRSGYGNATVTRHGVDEFRNPGITRELIDTVLAAVA